MGEQAKQRGKTIVLAGNPNAGKSVIFSALTGKYQEVSNFPGTTVELNHGLWNGFTIVDTPGVYGLSALNVEECAVRDAVLTADMVINVVNGVNLHSDLFLTCQLIDAGVPLVVALNFGDEVERFNLEINRERLEEMLGVPVVVTVASEKKGLDKIKAHLRRDGEELRGKANRRIAVEVDEFMRKYQFCPLESLLLLEGDRDVAGRYGLTPGNRRDVFYAWRRQLVDEIVSTVVREKDGQDSPAAKLGRWMLNPVTGLPILAFTLWVTYEVVGVFFAQYLVGFTEEVVMGEYYRPAVLYLVSRFFSPDSVFTVILAGKFGLLTMAVIYVFGLLFPLVFGFFLVLSFLEDCGYLPRIAILADRVTGYLGLNGQAIIPLILGFGCVTMASVTTRILGSRRERRIAIFLLALAVPCSAQLAFITAMLAGMGPGYLILYVIIIISILAGAGTVAGSILPGSASPLVVDLPPLRLPRLMNVWAKTRERTFGFIKEAIPLFAAGALLLSSMEVSGLLSLIQSALQPLTFGWLGLPPDSAGAFIMGFIRRDFGTAGIMDMEIAPLQQFVALVTLTLFVPCIASTMVIFKELGWRDTVIIWPSVFIVAFGVGGFVARMLKLFPDPWAFPFTAAVFIAIPVTLIIIKMFREGKHYW